MGRKSYEVFVKEIDSIYEVFVKEIDSIYEDIVRARRKLFKIPSGKAGKEFIKELTFWLRQFNTSSNLNSIALKYTWHSPHFFYRNLQHNQKLKNTQFA